MELVYCENWHQLLYPSEARSTMKKWREEHTRRSDEVVEIWEHVLSRYSSRLKDELWTVLEQVSAAGGMTALDNMWRE